MEEENDKGISYAYSVSAMDARTTQYVEEQYEEQKAAVVAMVCDDFVARKEEYSKREKRILI